MIVTVVVAYLVISLAAIVAVDVLNVFGLRDALEASQVQPPTLWFQLHEEGRITEWLQWGCLGWLALVSARLSGGLQGGGYFVASKYWALISALALLLLVEDAGNPRNVLGMYAVWMTGTDLAYSAAETAFFCFLGAFALYAVVIYGAVPRQSTPSFRRLVAGVAFYAVASGMSATSWIGQWYFTAGDFLRRSIFRDRLPRLDFREFVHPANDDLTSFYLMDRLVEESLELVAAMFLVLSALAYLRHQRDEPTVAEVTDGLWARKSLFVDR